MLCAYVALCLSTLLHGFVCVLCCQINHTVTVCPSYFTLSSGNAVTDTHECRCPVSALYDCRIKIAIRDLKEGESQDMWLDFENPKEEVRVDLHCSADYIICMLYCRLCRRLCNPHAILKAVQQHARLHFVLCYRSHKLYQSCRLEHLGIVCFAQSTVATAERYNHANHVARSSRQKGCSLYDCVSDCLSLSVRE